MALFGLDEVKEVVEVKEKSSKLTPFDIMKHIGNKQGFRLDDDNTSSYSPWIINKFYSFFPESALYAANMTEFSDLDVSMQYDYYYHSMKRGNKFTKWMKEDKDENLVLISEHYKVNRTRAQEMLALSPNLVEEIKAQYGGQ
jgi:hypothetical protein